MKQIYIFDHSTQGTQYGIGSYIGQLLLCLRGGDLQINLVFLYANVKKLHIEKKNDIQYFYIPKVENNSSFDKEKKNDRYLRASVYLLAPYVDEKCELIFQVNYFNTLSLTNTIKEFWPLSKVLLTIHYFEWCFDLKGNTSAFRRILHKSSDLTREETMLLEQYKKDRILMESVDCVICLSEYTQKLLLADYNLNPNQVCLAYNGLEDKAILLEKEQRIKLKEELHFNPEEQILLFVGRLDDVKGVDYLLHAFRIVVGKNRKIRLLVVGDGYFQKYLNSCSGLWNKITFTGRLSTSDLYKLYQIADIGIMPSFHEQCSYVAIEMMMHGIPLVASSTTGLKEMTNDCMDSYRIDIIEKKGKTDIDSVAFAATLEKVLALNPDELSRLRQKLRACYEGKYTLSSMISRYNDIVKSISDY